MSMQCMICLPVLLFSQVGVMTTRGGAVAGMGRLVAEPVTLTVMLPARMTCTQQHNASSAICKIMFATSATQRLFAEGQTHLPQVIMHETAGMPRYHVVMVVTVTVMHRQCER